MAQTPDIRPFAAKPCTLFRWKILPQVLVFNAGSERGRAGRDRRGDLNESTLYGYQIPPDSGIWLEVFNSDVYENWVNPIIAGNGGSIRQKARHSMGYHIRRTSPSRQMRCSYLRATLAIRDLHLSRRVRRISQ